MRYAKFNNDYRLDDLSGQTALVTGTRGIGLEVASALHLRGASTCVVGLNRSSGDAALHRLANERPDIPCIFEQVNLGDLGSVHALVNRYRDRINRLDILVNNAGIVTGSRELTEQGWERNIGVNYLGHFALTGLLLPALRSSTNGRVVSVVSKGVANHKLRLNDLSYENAFNPITAYSESKLALLTFGSYLNTMSIAGEWGIASYLAHPGICPTRIMDGAFASPTARRIVQRLYRMIGHPPAQAALSIIRCATDRMLQPGEVMGPSGLMELRGRPAASALKKSIPPLSEARALWSMSQSATGMPFPS